MVELDHISKVDQFVSEDMNYNGNPFSYEKILRPDLEVSEDVLQSILKFQDIHEDFSFLYKSLHKNPSAYGINNDQYSRLKNKYFREVELLEPEVIEPTTEIHEVQPDVIISSGIHNLHVSPNVIIENYERNISEDIQDDSNDYVQNNDIEESHRIIFSRIEPMTQSKIEIEKKNLRRLTINELRETILKKNMINSTLKKGNIISYLDSIGTKISMKDLEEFSDDEIEQLVDIINNIKRESKIDISFYILKALMVLIERVMVGVFKIKGFSNLSKDFTYDVMKTDLYSTHQFIDQYTNRINSPFVDLFVYVFKNFLFSVSE